MRPVLPLVLLCSLAAAHEWNGLARDDAGNLFAIDAEDGQVWRIDVQGVVTLHLPGSRMEICNHPHHLAFDAQGALWIPGG